MANPVAYELQHRGAPPQVGLVVMLADFGQEGAPPVSQDWYEEVRWRLQEIDQLVGKAQADRCGYDAEYAEYQASMAQVLDHDIGPIRDYVQQIAGLIPPPGKPEPVPPDPTPAPKVLGGVIGSYPGHDPAVDSYCGWTEDQTHWGAHHGIPIIAPADGRVQVYQFGTPLEALATTHSVDWHALGDGWVCRADAMQTMFVAVWFPFAPFSVEGTRIGHLHYGHVRNDVKAGPVVKGERFATSWDSGVRFEPGNPVARCAHTHCCAGAGTTLSPNGDLPGRLAAIAQGWVITNVGRLPGPQDYQVPSLWCAGRLYQDFVKAGRQPPPMPG